METVLYVGLFALVSAMILTALMQSLQSFNKLRVSRDINDSAVYIMERLTRDIKGATAIDLANSTFNVSPGRLTMMTLSASGTPLSVEYYVSGDQLRVREAGVEKGALISSRSKIDGLVFRYITAGGTAGVKIELHLKSEHGSASSVSHFYNTALMRGMY